MKIKGLLISVCIFITVNSVHAQWQQSTLPTDYIVTDIMQSNSYVFVATSNHGILKTQNFTDWSPSGSGISTDNVYEIISVIEQGAYITFYAATDAGAFRSTMLGYSWTPINNGITTLNLSAIFSDGTYLFAGAAGAAYRSEDYGQTWVPITIGTSNQVVTCFFRNGNDLLAGLMNSGNYLYRSTDNGLTWQPYGTGLYEIQQIAKLGDELFAISATVMYHSLDNGATWTLAGPGLVPGMYITDLFPYEDYLYVATMDGGYIQHTDSTNFRLLTNGMPMGGSMLSAVAANQDQIIFGTINNGLWYADQGIITGGIETSKYSDEISLYPNPTAGEFSVYMQGSSFSQSSGKNPDQVIVADLAGVSIKTINAKPGVCSNQFNISDLPAGIYFVRILIEGKWIIRKLVKKP